MTHWAFDAIFYHIYPLGFCGAPEYNDGRPNAVPRLEKIFPWIDHLKALGVNALYLGPLFESSTHGYDTADYFRVDRRLGDNALLARLVQRLGEGGIRVILDGVFNHVGRAFWAFRHVQEHGPASPYQDWFAGLRFGRSSPLGDPFSYKTWNGFNELVKLNLKNPAVREHLLEAVSHWVNDYGIAGLRLDAADSIDPEFFRELSRFCRVRWPDFYLMGEVIHGDYRQYANPEMLDATTNYECYKGLYSSLNDRNYFEIAASLRRQFGPWGLYRGLPLYNFLDNHDVNRIATSLTAKTHLYPAHILLFAMPGVPSIYYGSEWGISGRKERNSHRRLRPPMPDPAHKRGRPHPDLAATISRLSGIRRSVAALRHGDYHELAVSSEQLAFARCFEGQLAVVLLNAASTPASMTLRLEPLFRQLAEAGSGGQVVGNAGQSTGNGRASGHLVRPLSPPNRLVDLLNPGEIFEVDSRGELRVDPLYPCWGRILVPEGHSASTAFAGPA